MFALIRQRLRTLLRLEPNDALEPVRPIVANDSESAAELERRRDAITFKPTQGFIHERFHERRN